jgi:predicted molibdopterin-dependent oxidoreductase YjgC
MGAAGFVFDHPAQIMDEIASVNPFYKGICYESLEKGAVVWPSGVSTLHAKEFYTRTGRGKLMPLEYKGPAERPDLEFPLILVTRRNTLYYGVCAHKVEGFRQLAPREDVEMNPKDADDFGINDGEEVRVVSRRGEIKAPVKVTEDVPPGVIVLGYNSPRNPGNILAAEEVKACPVRVEK